jgi:hypothetical protein
MNDRTDDIETRLRQVPAPDLPDGLRSRVLAAADLVPAVTWRDRVWFSTRWRLAAAALVLALLTADRWVGPPRPAGSPDSDAATAAQLQALEAVGAEIGLPPETMRRLGGRSGFSQPGGRVTLDEALEAVEQVRDTDAHVR